MHGTGRQIVPAWAGQKSNRCIASKTWFFGIDTNGGWIPCDRTTLLATFQLLQQTWTWMAMTASWPKLNRPSTAVSPWLLMLMRRSCCTAPPGATPIPLFGRASTIEPVRVPSTVLACTLRAQHANLINTLVTSTKGAVSANARGR